MVGAAVRVCVRVCVLEGNKAIHFVHSQFDHTTGHMRAAGATSLISPTPRLHPPIALRFVDK